MRRLRDYSICLWLVDHVSSKPESCVEWSYIVRAAELSQAVELALRESAVSEELKVKRVFEMNVEELNRSVSGGEDSAKIVSGPFRQELSKAKHEGFLKRLLRL